MCAAYATPPPEEEDKKEFINCKINQNPKTQSALIFINWLKKPNGIKTQTLAFGQLIKYAPNTPPIAPLAPIIGICELISINTWDIAAPTPETK